MATEEKKTSAPAAAKPQPLAQYYPLGALVKESVLCPLWPNRLVPLKSRKPIQFMDTDGKITGKGYVLDLRTAGFDTFVELQRLFPEAGDTDTLMAVCELAVAEAHFEAIV